MVNLNLASAYNKKGFRIKATKYFEKYLQYETKATSKEYLLIKHTIANLTAKVDFFTRKLEEYKAKRDIKTIAALYLKMIATYANLPNIYANIAEIFFFDKNYEKALEFFLTVYLNYPHTPKILLDVANLCFLLNKPSYAYCYYSKAIKHLVEGTSFYVKAQEKIRALKSTTHNGRGWRSIAATAVGSSEPLHTLTGRLKVINYPSSHIRAAL